MTPEEAVDFLDELTSKALVNREMQDKIQQALTVLRKVIKVEKEEYERETARDPTSVAK